MINLEKKSKEHQTSQNLYREENVENLLLPVSRKVKNIKQVRNGSLHKYSTLLLAENMQHMWVVKNIFQYNGVY